MLAQPSCWFAKDCRSCDEMFEKVIDGDENNHEHVFGFCNSVSLYGSVAGLSSWSLVSAPFTHALVSSVKSL